MSEDVNADVITVRYHGKIRWFRSDRELWILDLNKRRDEFVSCGVNFPDLGEEYRFGIRVVNFETVERFLDEMSNFEISKNELSLEFLGRFNSAGSWWDVQDLFPVMFVDFDERRVAAFYSEGIPVDRYVPDGWIGEFADFSTKYNEETFPAAEKFWIQDGSDLLRVLNERGSKQFV
jgi:hypothetical protein